MAARGAGSKTARKAIDPFTPPEDAAKAARLRHVSDAQPGIARTRSGRGFGYRDPSGARITDRDTLARIRALAIPPAWTNVWICPSPEGHLQATGRDARGRKQYRYHPRWHVVRDETKYGRMREFGAALPQIRAQVAADLARPGIPRERVLASIVHLLENSLIRIGNQEYARDNNSFGLTTFKNRHVEVDGSQIQFRFKGKSGKSHTVSVHDRRLARLVQRLRDLPGQDLFQYLDEEGHPVPVTSADVNEYLRSISGRDFTAKDFRTWSGSLLAAQQLSASNPFESGEPQKAALRAAISAVAARLGNTAAVCRKAYIHPAVLAAFEEQEILDRWYAATARQRARIGMSADEGALLRFLSDSSPDSKSV
jgi:DNA topoisomerase-1